MIRRISGWVVLVLTLVVPVAPADGQGFELPAGEERILYMRELDHFTDPEGLIEFESVLLPQVQQRFRKNPDYQNKDFQVDTWYWIRIPIHHIQTQEQVWLLEFYDQTIDQIEAYLPSERGGYSRWIMGDHFPFTQRNIQHKNFEVPLTMRKDTTLVYYFKVRSHAFADIRIAFRSDRRFINYALNEYFLYGTFYGMILIIALYNFLVYLAIREIKNLYYILYILSVALYAMSLDGIAFQYLWPDHPDWNDYAVGISLYSVILWALVFTRRFLSTKAKSPHLDRLLVGMIILRTVVFLVEFLYFPEFFEYRMVEILPLGLIFYTGVKIWMRGYRPARFFVIAYGLLLSGFLLRSLVYFNILSITILSHYSLHLSFVVEMLFLTFALGDRIRILKNNRDRALKRIIQQHELNMQLKDKVNRELEEKVRERTLELDRKNRELEESNEKLTVQSREINQINSLLDLDNWKLKNKVKEVLEERLHEKVMEYSEFKTIYADALACYRFLETLKWSKGYQCRRCANEKYFEGAQKFGRRCTRCGYNESITSYTVFHGIKFPIEKAFYIAYVAVAARKKVTIEELAHTLDLRMNTVWGFRKRIAERIGELELKGNRPTAANWEDVILIASAETRAGIRSRVKGLIRSSLGRLRR
ncbi:MAG: receptor [Cyclobacteriaceae bacterium]|nr:receptor [Cyclobacteriaceae bacterium]